MKMKLLNLTLLLFAVGCSTNSISIQTNPLGADVYIKSVGQQKFKHFGQTPIHLTNRQLHDVHAEYGAVQIELRKDGYKPDSFYVTEISKIDLTIVRTMESKKDLEQQVWLNTQVEDIFEVTRLVKAARYADALELIQRIKNEIPSVATVHELEGGILLLRGDYRAAVDAYRLAVKYNPENVEAARMVEKLERTYGFPKEIDVLAIPRKQLDDRMPAEVEKTPTEPQPGGEK